MRATWPLALLLTVGCTGTEGDGRDDSFGGSGAKEDGAFSTCQLAEVIKLVNESTSTTDKLTDLGLSDDAAKSIVAHRNGPDGDPGTGDDDIYDDLNELDGVDFVGNLALGKLVFAILPRCEDDLKDRPFIDDKTFTGQSGGFARDNEEVEVVLGVQGLTGQRLRSLLIQTDGSGRTLYQRIRRNRIMEAFTYSFSLDEMPWDATSQAARERMPLVALSIEAERFAINDEGERELSVGTDLMDDTYYDTHAYSLLGNGIQLRGRARWDNPTTVRRLLIAAKFGTEIDADGNKTTAKVDIRNDGASATEIADLDKDVRRGMTRWDGSDEAAEPVRGVYEQVMAKNLLLDIGARKGVLLLEPAAHLRSTRSRYHMNEASITNVRTVFTNGATRIQNALNVVERAKTAGIIPAGDRAAVDAFEVAAKGVLDETLLAERITAAGVAITAAELKLPHEFPEPTSNAELEKHRVISETINTVYHELATNLDDVDRIITNAVDEDFDDYVDYFRTWRVSLDNTMARKTTYDSFLASHRSLSTAANRAKALADFNAFGEAQKATNNDFDDFEPLDEAGWDRLEGYLEKAVLTIGERQLATAGLAGRMLWFDQARAHWVPDSSRSFGNFMIDTTDMTDMLSHEEWTSVSEADRTFSAPLPAAKVFNTTFVNELQIELGREEAYVARLKELDAAIAADPSNADLAAQVEGARFVWNEYRGAMKVLAELKGEQILTRLRRAGAPNDITWEAPADSKGNIALKILSDRD
jgi:hypothetical protein